MPSEVELYLHLGVRKKYRSSSESVRVCDVMMLSQSDGVGEVAWVNESPTCGKWYLYNCSGKLLLEAPISKKQF